jgi:colanic acid/amylovoran biosynthesis glycosyltransferase
VDQRVKDFYCRFSGQLLADYVYGNPRIEAAIQHALCWIPRNARRILDVGCGIGWSTWEIKRSRPEAFVLGIDLSSESIQIAQALFEENQLVFVPHDITEGNAVLQPLFDVIVMLDVYEHIAKELRGKLHQLLANTLELAGTAVLTFPTPAYQHFLRTRHPERLQPIDEDVTKEDVSVLARDIQAEVVDFHDVSIWQTNDYVHLALKRDSTLSGSDGYKNGRISGLESRDVRLRRVASRLKMRVTQEGLLLSERDGPVVCIVSPSQNAYSETFIRNHIERLPAKIKLVYGGRFPTYLEDGTRLLASRVHQRAFRYASRRLLRLPPQYFEEEALKRFLRTNEVDVVLAEYGLAGASVANVCSEADVPLIVHFHGFDAYEHQTLDKYASSYQRMFDVASAVIAVSRDMERQLLMLGAVREKLFYAPYGVDTELFSGAEPARVPPVFVAAGRFVDKKAPHLTLLAFQKVWERCQHARLIMIGAGELWESCKQIARAMEISQIVEFLGPRPHIDIAVTMRQARAFVQHSMRTTSGDSEGTPVAVLEAGAAGLPVVATRHCGIQDVVIEGETGLLVDEGDVEGMARAMIRLAEDPELAGRLGKAARKRITADWSLEKRMDRLLNIIKTVIRKQESLAH